jgi:hypothetical protein
LPRDPTAFLFLPQHAVPISIINGRLFVFDGVKKKSSKSTKDLRPLQMQ